MSLGPYRPATQAVPPAVIGLLLLVTAVLAIAFIVAANVIHTL